MTTDRAGRIIARTLSGVAMTCALVFINLGAVHAQTASGFTLSGSVMTAAGRPLVGAFVSSGGRTVETNTAGLYTIQLPPASQLLALAWAPAFSQEMLQIRSQNGANMQGEVHVNFAGQFALQSAFVNGADGATLSGLPVDSAPAVHVIHLRGASHVPLETRVAVTLPNGRVKTYALHITGSDFVSQLRFQANGAYQVEVNATSGLPVFNVTVFHGVAPQPPSAPNFPVDPASASVTRLHQFTLSLINQVRANAHLRPLVLQPRLVSEASRHTVEVVRDGYFLVHPHIGANGSTPWQRVAATGLHVHTTGECVGEGSTIGMTIAAFLASPSHRAILLGHYRWVGIGLTYTNSMVMITLDLAR